MTTSPPTPATPPPGRGGAGERTWSIAELADEFDVTHRTLRHYEALGLLRPAREGTRRVFRRRDRVRLSLILRGRRLGFPLEEIRHIVDMYDDQPGEAGQLRYLLGQIEARRADLEQRRRDVEEALAELDELGRRCVADLEGLEGGAAAAVVRGGGAGASPTPPTPPAARG